MFRLCDKLINDILCYRIKFLIALNAIMLLLQNQKKIDEEEP